MIKHEEARNYARSCWDVRLVLEYIDQQEAKDIKQEKVSKLLGLYQKLIKDLANDSKYDDDEHVDMFNSSLRQLIKIGKEMK